MHILYFNDDQKNSWNEFVTSNAEDGGLLQSFEWGDFQKSLGKKIWRLGVVDGDDKLVASYLAFKDDLALRQKTIEVYRGPVVDLRLKDEDFRLILDNLIEELKKIAKKEKAIVIRTDFGINKKGPLQVTDYKLQKLGFVRANRDIQPRSTFFINLENKEKDILQKMKSKHRYNIRLAEKKGVKIKLSYKQSAPSSCHSRARLQRCSNCGQEGGNLVPEKDFENFWELLETTSKRDNFAIHDKDYYWKLLNNSWGATKLYLATFEGEIIAGALVGCFGRVCTYMHGASSGEHKNMMAPYLLQWQAILDAKNKGKKYYDLGGVKSTEEGSSSQKSWDGITRFKIGFCPNNEVVEFLGLWNLPVNKMKYYLYNFIRSTIKSLKIN